MPAQTIIATLSMHHSSWERYLNRDTAWRFAYIPIEMHSTECNLASRVQQSDRLQSQSHEANPEDTSSRNGQKPVYLMTSQSEIPNVDLSRLTLEGNLEAMSLWRGSRQVAIACGFEPYEADKIFEASRRKYLERIVNTPQIAAANRMLRKPTFKST